MITGSVDGFANLELALKQINQSVAPKALRAALRSGGKVVENAMQQNARGAFETQTGVLQESIKMKTTLNKKQNHNIYDAAVYVGVYNVRSLQKTIGRDIPANVLAYWIETGVKPHDLNAKSKRSRDKKGAGENNFHPGFTARPFIRPALLNNEDRVINETRSTLKKQIERAAKKAAKQKR